MKEQEQKNENPRDLVVIGSSAGGIEALSILVETLPTNFPAPVVLAQHLDPTRPSSLDQILQKRTTLPVEVVMTSAFLQEGHIYVIPANRHVRIQNHSVQVQEKPLKRPHPCVDTLLSTAAEAYGEYLIAVILTGSGSDGTLGAIDVKNTGGVVIVQNPQTARYPSMPLSLPPTIIDYTLNIELIGSLLYKLLTEARSIPHTEGGIADVLQEILAQVNRQASIDFRTYKQSTILRRIGRRMTATNHRNMQDYAEYVKMYPEEVRELVKAFLINVTQFFRDAEAFEYLKSDILPKLIAQARERDHGLRIWTAGCATGEEPYSLAMILTNLLGTELPAWNIKIFATDLDDAAINFARRGVYSESLLKDMPNEYRDTFFERIEHGYRIAKTLRQMVIFGQQDLSRSAPFPRIDLVLCRNVLIYFTPELQDSILSQFAFSLYPNGYLFLGRAETVRPIQTVYELVNKQWKIYQCREETLSSVHRRPFSDSSMLHLNGYHHKNLEQQQAEQEASKASLGITQLQRCNEVLLRSLPVGVVVINRSYHIITANAAARHLLGLRNTGVQQDFLHAARGIPYQKMRQTIDSLFLERNPINLVEIELEATAGGNVRYISLSLALVHREAGLPDLAIVSATDVTQQVHVRRQLDTMQTEQVQLMNELRTTNKHLSDINKELLDTNEALQIANEELVLTHEELQASIEEFETTNEEVQSTNEELETNNEELQATNEELETTNDELRARTSELQELTTQLENERARLAEMVELAPFYILVLRGPNLIIEAYNPRYARAVENRPVQGRPLNEVVDLFWETGLEILHLARDTYRLDAIQSTRRILTSFPHQQVDGELVKSYLTYTAVPSHDTSGKIDGVMIYSLDETQRHLREIEEEHQRLKLIFNNLSMAALALFDAQTGNLIMGSTRYLKMIASIHHLKQDELISHNWQELTLIPSQEQAIHLWQTALENQTATYIAELPYKHPHGAKIVWDYTLTPILDTEEPGKIRFVLVSAVDITDQVQAQKELEALGNLKDEFLSLASHELRSPLTAIQGNAQLLQRTIKKQQKTLTSNTEQEQRLDREVVMLDTITRQTSRMNKLITEILDTTRIRGQMFGLQRKENVNIIELAQRVIEQYLPNEQQSSIILQSEQKAILGMWDDDRIEQVLHNLITNALKYSPATQPIVVKIERHSENPENAIIVSVQDHGLGIREEDQAYIFDRFYRVSNGERKMQDGLGLGLYISHEIVTQHGGRMWVKSSPGQGSTFYFVLPLKNVSQDRVSLQPKDKRREAIEQ